MVFGPTGPSGPDTESALLFIASLYRASKFIGANCTAGKPPFTNKESNVSLKYGNKTLGQTTPIMFDNCSSFAPSMLKIPACLISTRKPFFPSSNFDVTVALSTTSCTSPSSREPLVLISTPSSGFHSPRNISGLAGDSKEASFKYIRSIFKDTEGFDKFELPLLFLYHRKILASPFGHSASQPIDRAKTIFAKNDPSGT